MLSDKPKRRGGKRVLFIALTIVVSLVAALVLVEVVCVAWLSIRDRGFTSARQRFERDANSFVRALTAQADCSYVDTLFPHPYLAFVHHGNPPCGISSINNIGLFGPGFPHEKLQDRFVILLTGGSVAAQLGQIMPTGPRLLEVELNQRYKSPTGQPFLVLNGGDGAWKQPQQTILFLLYADVIDAVVTLDGFNESLVIGGPSRFEYPASNFLLVNPHVASSYSSVLMDWGLGRLLAFVRSNALLSRSHAAYSAMRGLHAVRERLRMASPPKRTTVESMFAIPSDWSSEKRFQWGIDQFKKYTLTITSIARSRRIHAVHFIQPVPAIGKELTARERAVVGDLSYRDRYRRITDGLLNLREQGADVHSLLEVFAGVPETVYADPIHLERDSHGDSPGYRLVARHMADTLAKSWSLAVKN